MGCARRRHHVEQELGDERYVRTLPPFESPGGSDPLTLSLPLPSRARARPPATPRRRFPVSEAADADWIEKPIPEQFVSSVLANNTVKTTVSELYSS